MEKIKHDSDDFGGFQTRRMPPGELQQRLCARRWCSDFGLVQLIIPFENPAMYRTVCGKHFVMIMMIAAAAMGDPSPLGEGRRIAEAMGLNWSPAVAELNVPQIIDPSVAVCARCGGKFEPEPIGMYAGKRWIHTCPDEQEGGG